jgi:hypothetical protein
MEQYFPLRIAPVFFLRDQGHKVNCYLLKGNQQLGPFSIEQIQTFLKQDMVTASDLMWIEGWPSWMPIGQVPGLGFQIATETQQSEGAVGTGVSAQPMPHPASPSLQSQRIVQSNGSIRLIPAWCWVSIAILLVFYELTALARILIFSDQSSLQGQAAYMSSSDYQTEKGWESFFRGMVGDMGTASEEADKYQSINSQYENDSSTLLAFYIFQCAFGFGMLGLIVALAFKHSFFSHWKRITDNGANKDEMAFVYKDAFVIVLGVAAIGIFIPYSLFWLGGFEIGKELLRMLYEPLVVAIMLRVYWLVTIRYSA